eukprot:1693652-Amphidinium_carterae.1
MAHGGPAADPQVSADLSTAPLSDNMWDNALRPGRGRGPTRNLKQLRRLDLQWTVVLVGRSHSSC